MSIEVIENVLFLKYCYYNISVELRTTYCEIGY